MTPARLEFYRNPNFLTWIHAEASEIDSDGCTGVTGLQRECCEIHDVEFWYGKDARDAYRKFREGVQDYWAQAKPITFAEANANKRRCMQARSTLGMYSPHAILRWLGLKYLPRTRRAWEKHRQREHAEGVI